MSYASQSDYAIRFEWGLKGALALDPADSIVIVDVLSFTTCIDIVVAQGGEVYPFRYNDERAKAYAKQVGAVLAGPRSTDTGPSLSPASLTASGPLRLALPSPNGSEITSRLSGAVPLFGACLRNARAVADRLRIFGSITVIAAGERWPDGSLRFAIEDLIGAGAVIEALGGSKSPEASLAEAAFRDGESSIKDLLQECASGRELIERGFERDVELAAELNVSEAVPGLADGRFTNLSI